MVGVEGSCLQVGDDGYSVVNRYPCTEPTSE